MDSRTLPKCSSENRHRFLWCFLCDGMRHFCDFGQRNLSLPIEQSLTWLRMADRIRAVFTFSRIGRKRDETNSASRDDVRHHRVERGRCHAWTSFSATSLKAIHNSVLRTQLQQQLSIQLLSTINKHHRVDKLRDTACHNAGHADDNAGRYCIQTRGVGNS